jgi:hypothetical protein
VKQFRKEPTVKWEKSVSRECNKPASTDKSVRGLCSKNRWGLCVDAQVILYLYLLNHQAVVSLIPRPLYSSAKKSPVGCWVGPRAGLHADRQASLSPLVFEPKVSFHTILTGLTKLQGLSAHSVWFLYLCTCLFPRGSTVQTLYDFSISVHVCFHEVPQYRLCMKLLFLVSSVRCVMTVDLLVPAEGAGRLGEPPDRCHALDLLKNQNWGAEENVPTVDTQYWNYLSTCVKKWAREIEFG